MSVLKKSEKTVIGYMQKKTFCCILISYFVNMIKLSTKIATCIDTGRAMKVLRI